MQNLLFSFADLSVKDKVVKELARQFKRAGAEVAQTEVLQKLMRSSGVSFKEIHLVFADSQTVVLQVKQTGDIFQALLNKKILPIKQQDNHVAAITEIVKAMEMGRSKFQKALALIRVKLPSGIKTAAPKMLEALTKKRDDAKAALAEAGERITALQAELTSIESPVLDAVGGSNGAIVRLEGNELGEFSSMSDLRQKAMAHAEQRFIGKKFINESTGNEIHVSKTGVKHTISNSSDELVRTIPAIPDLIRKAKMVYSKEDKGGDPNIKAVESYEAGLEIGGKKRKAILTVKVYQDGRRYYDHGLVK